MDLNQLAKRIVDEAIGEEPITPKPKEKNQAAVELGRLGGKARSEKLTSEQKSEIAKKAALKRKATTESLADDLDQSEQKKTKQGVISSPDF